MTFITDFAQKIVCTVIFNSKFYQFKMDTFSVFLLVFIQFLKDPKFHDDFYNRFCTHKKSLSPQFSILNFIICLMVGFQQGHILHFLLDFKNKNSKLTFIVNRTKNLRFCFILYYIEQISSTSKQLFFYI